MRDEGINGAPTWTTDELAMLHAGALDRDDEARLRHAIHGDLEALLILDALDRTVADIRRFAALTESPPPDLDLPSGRVSASEVESPEASGPLHVNLPPSNRRVAVILAVSLVLVAIASALALYHNEDTQQSASGSAQHSNGPVAAGVSFPMLPPNVVRTNLSVDGIQATTLLMGPLREVVSTLGPDIMPTVDQTLLNTQPDVCVETLVASGFPGKRRVIYAQNMPGWTGAEQEPLGLDDASSIHQQLIVPPAELTSGASVTGFARFASSELNTKSAPFVLKLNLREGDLQEWIVDEQVTRCRAIS